MKNFHPAVFKLSAIQPPKFLHTISHHPNHSVAHLNASHSPPHSDSHQAKMAATHLSNCKNLPQLNRIYAQIIRTCLLDLHPLSFHWNNLIRSYTRLDAPHKALSIFVSMLRAGVSPDSYTLPIVLKAICQVFAFDIGLQLHSVAVRHGLNSNEYCESGLISLYSKAGEFENARKVFDENPDRKLGSWNAVIGGLSQGGLAAEAVGIFVEMMRCGLKPDDVTMVSVISSCGSLGDLNLGLQLHKFVFQARSLAKSDILMLNSLIDMYGKCGRVDLANEVFSRMEERNVSSWTSMIVGHAAQGQYTAALECFRCMREAGVMPNQVTFIGVLSACVHGGMVQQGKRYFAMMKNVYGLMPQMQHYGCMVDLLGRAGLLEEARDMVEAMPMEANVVIWGCLMGSCEKHENVKMGEWVAEHLQKLEPWSDGAYVVLSNIYASKCMWKEVERLRQIMKKKKLDKTPGYSLTTKSD